MDFERVEQFENTDGAVDRPFVPGEFLRTLTSQPGIYQMFGQGSRLLYVGKARNLRRRVSSYFQKQRHTPKTLAMLAQVTRVEVVVTHTETEALVLEANLIKRHHPPYNILLRDDKSYPYLFIETGHGTPRMSLHRGVQKGKGHYFGPYPAVTALRESMVLLQKAFRLRTCEDHTFHHRSRACLQFQIRRCSGPCVGHISGEDYARDVADTIRFLEGKSDEAIRSLGARMQAAAEQLDFEEAAQRRDQIAALSKIQERQYVAQAGGGDFDVLAAAQENGQWVVYVSFIRNGRQLGGRSVFPRHTEEVRAPDVLAAFLMQFYSDKEVPGNLLVNVLPRSPTSLAEALGSEAGHRVMIDQPQRGPRKRWMALALTNAMGALRQRTQTAGAGRRRMLLLQELFELPEMPQRVECFDISHTRGEVAVASCVVFGEDGALKNEYRRFNIRDIRGGDDYAAMEQAVHRRYGRLQKEGLALPEIVFIDGGAGQVARAQAALDALEIGCIQLCGVAKGTTRRPGLEMLHIPGWAVPRQLDDDDPALLVIQEIRDEAHRFAITGHRARRGKVRQESDLDGISGIGPKRRVALLRAFGGLRGIRDAGMEDLQRVEGIHLELAQRIYDFFHVGRA
ncbi:excinuclease ABC subunit UvrC [Acidithiobacillus ferrooxidans F221]|uniref:excinuclease ABC subunit UvrC n=1 Tax=Acidithiobacillus ferrooxidans TaxID=920 RepID=UPI001C0758C3|nr:excinuclease ABC subunit UvrC [Acidithiobacillus ferrooxidans]MBU2808250.1 excinuclease ABC subunit UvrC [Acidithiobacillus ferrooxidans F221]